jgi:hypothetical protein
MGTHRPRRSILPRTNTVRRKARFSVASAPERSPLVLSVPIASPHAHEEALLATPLRSDLKEALIPEPPPLRPA